MNENKNTKMDQNKNAYGNVAAATAPYTWRRFIATTKEKVQVAIDDLRQGWGVCCKIGHKCARAFSNFFNTMVKVSIVLIAAILLSQFYIQMNPSSAPEIYAAINSIFDSMDTLLTRICEIPQIVLQLIKDTFAPFTQLFS